MSEHTPKASGAEQVQMHKPVAWTNKAQLGYLKDYPDVPMAMWATAPSINPVALYATPAPVMPVGREITDAMVEVGARGAAKLRGHRDCDHLVVTTNEGKVPVWQFYTDISRAVLEAASALVPIAEKGEDWQPIETAPKDGTAIILTDCRKRDWTQIAFWDSERPNGYVWARDDASTFWHRDMFTHWRPLPARSLSHQSKEG